MEEAISNNEVREEKKDDRETISDDASEEIHYETEVDGTDW